MGFWSKLFGKKKKEERIEEKSDQVLARHAEKEDRLKEDGRNVSLEEVDTDIRTLEAVEPSRLKPERPKRQQIYEAEEKEVVERIQNVQEDVEDDAPEATLATESTTAEPTKAYDIKKHAKGWQVIAEGASRAYRVFDTQKEAIDFAKENGLEVTVYKADGTPK